MGTVTINLNSPMVVSILLGILGSIGAGIIRMVVFMVRIGPKHKGFTARINKNTEAHAENKKEIEDLKEVFNNYVKTSTENQHKDSMRVQKEMGDIKQLLGKMDGKMEMIINQGK